MSEPIAEHGEESGICGHDGDNWEKILIDASKRLVVAIASSDLPTGAAIAANQVLQLSRMLLASTTPHIYNVTMTTGGTEYSQAMIASTKRFMVRCRGDYEVKLAFTATESGTTYLTIPSGCIYWEDRLDLASKTLYFQCATAAQVLEIVTWG